MEVKHTAGPWICKNLDSTQAPQDETPTRINFYARDGQESVGCAYVVRGDVEKAKANARLMVIAPDLLAAAEAVISCWESGNLAGAVRHLALIIQGE